MADTNKKLTNVTIAVRPGVYNEGALIGVLHHDRPNGIWFFDHARGGPTYSPAFTTGAEALENARAWVAASPQTQEEKE